jgi:hypothetical protein
MRKLVVVLLALTVVPAAASAGTIAELWHYGPNVTITLTGYSESPFDTATGWAGITATGNIPGLANGVYEAYCVDLLHLSNNSSNVNSVTAGLLDWDMYESGTAGTRAAAASWLLNTYLGQPDTNRSALQLAIWEVLYEMNTAPTPPDSTTNPWMLGSGHISFSDTTANAAAQNYLDLAFVGGATTYTGNAVWIQTENFAGGYYQDFGTTTPVPEPGSILLLGSGMLGLAAALRRRPKK